VACHELLGHGTGKLIYVKEGEPLPEWTDPISGDKFKSAYKEGETWNGKFAEISASYEECRADTCGFYLASFKDVYTLFGFEDDQIGTLLYCNVMNQFRKGILGLSLFNKETSKWGQAHTQGGYVFTQYIYQNQKEKIVDFEINEKDQEFIIHLDKEKLMGEGRELIKQFLIILQVYKSTGNVERGREFYNKYS